MSTTAGSRYWAQRKRDAIIARREARVATARAHAAAGRSLTTAAEELGMPVKALRKCLDRARHHDLVVRLQRGEEAAT